MGMAPDARARIRRNFDRAAPSYDSHAVLQREVRERLSERLDDFSLVPARVLDLGCGPGASLLPLSRRYPKAQVVGVDLSTEMLHQFRPPRSPFRRNRVLSVAADMHRLPLASASVDLVFSSLALQWSDAPDALFAEIRRVLRPGGVFLFATLGPGTLKELRAALAAAGSPDRVRAFIDMHDLGDAMVRAGLREPVLDVDHLTLAYGDARAVMRDLKGIGATYPAKDAAPGLRGRGWLARVERGYEPHRQQGSLPASYEVVFGHAFGAEGQANQKLANETRVDATALLASLRKAGS